MYYNLTVRENTLNPFDLIILLFVIMHAIRQSTLHCTMLTMLHYGKKKILKCGNKRMAGRTYTSHAK